MYKGLSKCLTVLLVFLSISSFAQETVSSLSGVIKDEKGSLIQGATIQLLHVPTGAITKTQTNKNGIFNITNLKPGGPYTVSITFVGFKEEKADDVNLNLGNNPDLNVVMKVNTGSLEAVTVTTTKRNTNGITIGRAQMNTLPTLGRSITDFTRLTPQSNNNSFAGTNFRYNNLTVDGAVNNDAFGFSNSAGGVSGGGQSGAAGSGTRTNPYSIDVIQEVQVQLTPYDVKIGNFTGGSINAVTKSGTNDFHGSAYAYGRNQALVGKSVDGSNKKIGSDFHDYQYGATISGPIVKNKAFFIVNYEHTERQEPTFYNIYEDGTTDKGTPVLKSEADQIANKLKSLGYDPGSYLGAFKVFTKSDKLFGRLDFKLNNNNSLMIRAIYTNGSGNNLERSATNFQFGSNDFTQYTKNINLVAELKSKISTNLNNQFNVSYIHVDEYRTFPGVLAPYIDIDNARITVGTWREASIYNLKQKTVEISDNLTFTQGINKFTFGTHNEFYKLNYGFINSYNGRWEYSRGFNSFLNDNPSRIRGAFTTDPKVPSTRDELFNNTPNPFDIGLTSLYAQDDITVNSKFKLSPGIRFDYSFAGTQPYKDSSLNSTNSGNYVSSDPTYTNTPFKELTAKLPSRVATSPRLGFSYDVKGNQSIVIRGGTGIFTGRVPFAWYGYAYTLNGGTYGNIDWNGPKGPSATSPNGQYVPLAIDPAGLKDTVAKYSALYNAGNKANTREIDVFDNNFKLPTIWRSNIAVDLKFGNGFKFTTDFMYTKTIHDVKYQQINLKDSVTYFKTGGPTETPVYVGGKYNTNYSNVYFLTNTSEGYRYNITFQLSKFTNNIKLGSHRLNMNSSAAYTYGLSKDITNGIRNSWESSYNVNPSVTPGSSSLAYSNFDLRHRIVATWSGNFLWNKTNTTSVSFVYAGQSGNPYSVVYQSAPFGNGTNASLPYIPVSQSDIKLVDYTLHGIVYTAAQQWADLDAFINSDSYLKTRRGQYAERNGLRTPWVHQIDMKIMHEFKLSKTNNAHSLQVSMDVFNVLNLLNNSWGHVNFVTNINNYTVNFLKFVGTNPGQAGNIAPGAPSTGYSPTFNFIKPTGNDNHYYTLDPINSRFQAQLGIKYNF